MARSVNVVKVQEDLEKLNETDNNAITDMIRKIIMQDDFLGLSPYIYVFAHKRELGIDERFSLMIQGGYSSIEETPKARLIWAPRLTKPKAEPNSFLFRIELNHADDVETVWILPEEELFNLFKKGKVFENQIIHNSIYNFIHNKKELERPHEDDLKDKDAKQVYDAVARQARISKRVNAVFNAYKPSVRI